MEEAIGDCRASGIDQNFRNLNSVHIHLKSKLEDTILETCYSEKFQG